MFKNCLKNGSRCVFFQGILVFLMAITGGCPSGNVALANIPAKILEFNPNLTDLGKKAALKWELIDLNKAENGPMVGNFSYGINACDFDNDGDQDVVVVFQEGGAKVPGEDKHYGMVYILEYVSGKAGSDVKFRARLLDGVQVTPKDVVVVEQLKNGKRGVVIPAYKSGKTIVYQSDDGKKWDKIELSSKSLQGTVRAVAADIDKDGMVDFAVTSIAAEGAHLSWYRSVSGGQSGWEEVPIDVTLPQLVGVDAGDGDGDGDIDLVCGSEHSAWPFLLINLDGKGKSWKKVEMHVESEKEMLEWVRSFSDETIGQNHVKFTDVDGDGDMDCIETGLKNGYVAWRENVGNLKEWKFHKIAGNMGSVYFFDIGDVDRDGKVDIVAASAGGGGVYMFYNDGRGLKWKVMRLGDRAGLNWPNINRMVDINGDGWLDILATDWGSNAVLWLNANKN